MASKVQSCNLNEELGMVHYVFSDKTGTLTKNIMDFKKFSAGEYSYGVSNPSKRHYLPGVTNVNFECPLFEKDWTQAMSTKGKADNPYLEKMVKILAICHTAIVEKKNNIMTYNASSPDELALTNAARYFGLSFVDRDEDGNIIINDKFSDKDKKYELLNVIEFTSARKRMSVILRTPSGKIMIMSKGADSIMIERLAKGQEKMIEKTEKFLQHYAEEGLRTLLLAQKEVDIEFYNDWSQQYQQAMLSMTDRESKLNQIAELIEWDFEIVGSTAIEDKLQDEVASVIEHIHEAGVKLWVLTGDKIETAINIGFSCKLLDNAMELFIINKNSTKEIYK